jgi:hypothetical protein
MVSSDWNDDDCDKEGEHPSASSIAVACCLKSAACFGVNCPLFSFTSTV